MPLESGADGEARMETDQPWVGVRVPERAGCWPPARSIPASLLLQGRVLAPRPQHACFSPASGPGAGPPPAASLLLSCFRAGCWPRPQHPCFSPASGLGAGPPPAASLLLSCLLVALEPPFPRSPLPEYEAKEANCYLQSVAMPT